MLESLTPGTPAATLTPFENTCNSAMWSNVGLGCNSLMYLPMTPGLQLLSIFNKPSAPQVPESDPTVPAGHTPTEVDPYLVAATPSRVAHMISVHLSEMLQTPVTPHVPVIEPLLPVGHWVVTTAPLLLAGKRPCAGQSFVQGCVLHIWVSERNEQGFPPYNGCFAHVKVLVCVPPPQVFVQVVQEPKGPSTPSTGQGCVLHT